MGEEWRPVVGYEGLYSVSSLGRVRRDAARTSGKAGAIRTLSVKNGGYIGLSLCKDNKKKNVSVHRLVAEAFLGDPMGRDVNHKDCVRSNNSLDNLEYVTKLENNHYMMRLGRHYHGDRHASAKLSDRLVRWLRDAFPGGKMPNGSGRVAAEFVGITYGALWRAVTGRTWRHLSGMEPANN